MKETKPVIYKIRNKKNGKMYFGQTVNFQRRMNEYKNRKNTKSSKYHMMDVLNTEGIENFEFSIVEYCEKDQLDDREAYYIKKHNTTNPLFGYNSQKGEKDKRMFKRTRERMRESHLGLKEKASTKKKKSNAIYAINNSEFIISDSGKLFADYLGTSKDQVSHAIKRAIRIKSYYVYHQDFEKRNSLKTNSKSEEYYKLLDLLNNSVETIEKSHNVKYLHYTDEVE